MKERKVIRETTVSDGDVVLEEAPTREPGGGVVAPVVAVLAAVVVAWLLFNALGVL